MRLHIAPLAALVLAACAQVPQAPAPSPLGTETHELTTPSGEKIAYEIGTLYVPENRADPTSRRIGIGFVRIKAAQPTGAPPTLHLPGGPGDSYLGVFTDTDDWSRRKLEELLDYRQVGDVLVLDQRGASKRGEMLMFEPRLAPAPLDRPASIVAERTAFVEAARKAVASHPGKDLSGYNVKECAEDVNDLRKALGYEKISLVGQSFGSQWSFAVMRQHPEIVARALLSGVEPLDKAYDMPSHIFGAIQRRAAHAEADPRLKPYIPQEGLVGAVRTIRARLLQHPVRVRLDDGTTVVLGAEDFQRSMLLPPDRWPATVLSIYYGHYDDWAREIAKQRTKIEPEALIGPLIDTSLGVSEGREYVLRSDAAVEFLGHWDFDAYIASRPVWPSPDVGDEFRSAVQTEIPTVFVNGDWDVSTPPENMLTALAFFPNGRAVIVQKGEHSARAKLAELHAPVMQPILTFLRTGETKDLPSRVALPAPVYAMPNFPAPTRR